MNDEKKLLDFRAEKDHFFKESFESPLTEEQKHSPGGLKYFPPNDKLVFHNLPLEPADGEQIIPITTSTGDTENYKKLGKIKFEVDGTSSILTIFASLDDSHPFLPFKDRTNSTQTYGAGRYLEVEILNGKVLELDFNYAYSPYCAYNENYRCPLTPPENNLSVTIEAGEKKFKE